MIDSAETQHTILAFAGSLETASCEQDQRATASPFNEIDDLEEMFMSMAKQRRRRQLRPVTLLINGVICVSLVTMARSAGPPRGDEPPDLLGNWKGESMCQLKNSPCHDEKVIYHLARSKEPGKINISADKIVDGSPVNMGSGDFDYDQNNGTLISDSSHGVWKFVVHGKTMEGTLTLPDKTLYRRVTLRKEER